MDEFRSCGAHLLITRSLIRITLLVSAFFPQLVSSLFDCVCFWFWVRIGFSKIKSICHHFSEVHSKIEKMQKRGWISAKKKIVTSTSTLNKYQNSVDISRINPKMIQNNQNRFLSLFRTWEAKDQSIIIDTNEIRVTFDIHYLACAESRRDWLTKRATMTSSYNLE